MNFNQIPSNIRTPLFYAEFDNSNAVQGGISQGYKTLLVGNRRPSGTIAALVPQQISSKAQARTYFGADSILAEMASDFLDLNESTELWCMALDDLTGGAVATGTITIAGTPTAAGMVYLMVAGYHYQVGVATTDTATTIAAAIVAAINANPNSTVSAASVAGIVTVTSKHKGDFNNDIEIAVNHLDGEILPTGITATIVAMSGGAGNPDISAVWTILGDTQYMLIAAPYTDTANLVAIETELTSRWNALRSIEGFYISAKRGTLGTLATLGNSRNSQFVTIMGMRGPSNPWEWAAEVAAQVAQSASNDPALPFQTLKLNVWAPKVANRFMQSERNSLLNDGISTFIVDAGGNVLLESIITTYKSNAYGSPDPSYLYLNTPLTLSYIRADLKARLTSRYPRHKLANDGVRYSPGVQVVTPNGIKAEIINKFNEWAEKALVEDIDQFKRDLIVERNADNPNRVDVLMPPNLVNQLRILGVKIQYLL